MPAWRVCSTPGCPTVTERSGRCDECRAAADHARGTAAQRGYDHQHAVKFREPVLLKDPFCVCTDLGHGHGDPCGAISVHADHYPRSRDQLIALRLNPNDPRYGRGLCQGCHSKHTSEAQPGGWNAR